MTGKFGATLDEMTKAASEDDPPTPENNPLYHLFHEYVENRKRISRDPWFSRWSDLRDVRVGVIPFVSWCDDKELKERIRKETRGLVGLAAMKKYMELAGPPYGEKEE